MTNQSSNTSKVGSNRRRASNRKQRSAHVVSIPGNECGFISGPPHRAIHQPQLDISDIVSERFEPRKCLDNLGERLVCVAHDRVENREVVLKVQRKTAKDILTILEREAKVGEFLPQHENVAHLYRLYFWPGPDGGQLIALAMEYTDGGSLRHWMRHQANWDLSTQASALELFRSLCLGVGALHEQGILHLDLKPENTLIHSGVAKVADFGGADVSRFLQRAGSTEQIPALPCSWGTPNYMSPEQFTVRAMGELTEGADIYALGVILYEILNPAHRQPFTGSYQQLCRLHQTELVPELPQLTQSENELIRWCTVKDLRDRCESVDELIEAFDEVYPPRTTCAASNPKVDRTATDEVAARANTATELYEEVKRNMNDGDLEELLSLAAKAAEFCPDHPQADVVTVRLEHRVKVFTENIEAYKTELEAGRPESALLCAQYALAANPKSLIARQLVARLSQDLEQAKRLKAEMASAIDAGDFERAMQVAKQMDDAGIPADEGTVTAGGV